MKTKIVANLLLVLALLLALGAWGSTATLARSPAAPPSQGPTTDRVSVPNGAVRGPFVSRAVTPTVFNGDLRDLPQLESDPNAPQREAPAPVSPLDKRPVTPLPAADPVVQTWQGAGEMPPPIMNFAGMSRYEAGGWIPPDTNGDVGPNHYIQTVNVGIGIFDKATGAPLVKIGFNDLFDGTGTACDYANNGDPISLYDPMADRWLITDFAFPPGGSLECIAVSQTGDPVGGGWYFYALDAENLLGSWHDYPKLGVWPDAYYMTANMFDPPSGSKVWALDREAMLNGDPLTVVTFDLGSSHWSLLPANLRGPLPPAGAPNYMATVEFPDVFQIWEFHVDWDNPGNSTFTGPTDLTVADYGLIFDIPQPPPGALVDSLGDRPMMQLQYRNFGTHESLWVNHTVATGGVAGVRWYEIRDPGGTPFVFQQGTFQPDDQYRWMGSLAVDGEGNMAVGYSVASPTLMPGIRYAGRLYGEMPGALPQSEISLIEGTGVQTGASRWGDYSAMTVDPVDDCTFWYTTEYYTANGSNWQTRIGSFRFPSCGEPKGWISGTVYNAETMEGVPFAPVMAEGPEMTFTAQTDADGRFTMALLAGTYELTAGPLLPGYPDPNTITDVEVTVGNTTEQDIPLSPVPFLVEDTVWIDDFVVGGNNNGYVEPGESGLLLWESLLNTGAASATNVTATLTALTPGVTVDVDSADYPDIGPGESAANLDAFVFSIDENVPCGAVLDFEKTVTSDEGIYTVSFSLETGVALPPVSIFSDDMESGSGNWTTGGANNLWAITQEKAHSPTHAWSDSPFGNYPDYGNSWIQAPTFDLTGITGVTLSFWHTYALENGWDFGYPEVSINGGATWTALDSFTGSEEDWTQKMYAVPAFDNQPSATFRFHETSDTNTNEDGWYIDDVELWYEPIACYDPMIETGVPILISPPDGTVTSTQEITLVWEPDDTAGYPAGYNLELDGEVFTTTLPSYATTLDVGEHKWRVRAYNDLGYSDYTETWAVEIVELPGVPVLLTPPDGTVTSTLEITFSWQAGEGGPVEGYELELDGEVFATSEPSYTAILGLGEHEWRVRAHNDLGDYSDYSAAWMLTVEEPVVHIYLPIILHNP